MDEVTKKEEQKTEEQKKEEPKSTEINQEQKKDEDKPNQSKPDETKKTENDVLSELLKNPDFLKLIGGNDDMKKKIESLETELKKSSTEIETIRTKELLKSSGVDEKAYSDFMKLYPEAKTPEAINSALEKSPYFVPAKIPGTEGGGGKTTKEPVKPGELDYDKIKSPKFLEKVLGLGRL